MIGRRVATLHGITQPGDYAVILGEHGEVERLWCALPDGIVGRIPARGHGTLRSGEPEHEWEITLDAEGKATVSPSIDASCGGELPGKYHGHLTNGVWDP